MILPLAMTITQRHSPMPTTCYWNGRTIHGYLCEWQEMMESPLPQTQSKQTRDRTLRQRTITRKRPKQHTPTLPWARGPRAGSRPYWCRGGRGGSRDNVLCFRCGAMVHYASQCPETLEDAQRMLEENAETGTNIRHHTSMDDPMNDMDEATGEPMNEMTLASLELDEAEDHDTSFVFVQDVRNVQTQHGGCLPPEWILLDNQSTMDVFTN